LTDKVAVIVLTLNEEPNIRRCLGQFLGYVDFILVLDGGSMDKTVEIAKEWADEVFVKPFSGSFAQEKNFAWTLIPRSCSWVLWSDADERWDPDFLENMKAKISEATEKGVVCFSFPRINRPDRKNFPDYQIRFVKNSEDFEWRGKTHEVLWWKSENIPLDHADATSRERRVGIGKQDRHPITHLERRGNLRREWW